MLLLRSRALKRGVLFAATLKSNDFFAHSDNSESTGFAPHRFVDFKDACHGDIHAAEKRWIVTKQWRQDEGVDNILVEPQPNFFTIKAMYPHYFCGRGKNGQPVYYDRPGELNIQELHEKGIGEAEMLRHWLFITEYMWQIHMRSDQNQKSIVIIDVNGISWFKITQEVKHFVFTTVGWANQHYPERSHKIFICNAPTWSTLVWTLVKPLVAKATQEKVVIMQSNQVLPALLEEIDIDQIPEYYGGNLQYASKSTVASIDDQGLKAILANKDSCRFFSAEALALDSYVHNLNAKHVMLEDERQ